MANCQNTMRCNRRPVPVTPVQNPACRCRETDCSDTCTIFTENAVPAMAYIPWQKWKDILDPCKALECGTVFSQLNKPFTGKGGRCR